MYLRASGHGDLKSIKVYSLVSSVTKRSKQDLENVMVKLKYNSRFISLKDVVLDEKEWFDNGSEEGSNGRRLLSAIYIEYQRTCGDSESC